MSVITPYLQKLVVRTDLSQSEAAALLHALLDEAAHETEIAAVLTALAIKGETADELAGFASTMREHATRITGKHTKFIDTCGTGGSAVKTFNVSTAVAFIVAAAGLPVAKHGNVGVTTNVGSADVLRALGVNIDLAPAHVAEIFDKIGLCFMFAPHHHAATKRVAQVRRALGIRTIFNLLGPLTNPASAPFQVIGVSNEAACPKVAQALSKLGTTRAWVVRGQDGLDEITLTGKTVVHEASSQGVERFEISPEYFDLPRASLDSLHRGSALENAGLIRAVLSGERIDAARDLIVINAAASLYVAEMTDTMQRGAELAAEMIESGAALNKLEQLKTLSTHEP